jgi:hypothetical protein
LTSIASRQMKGRRSVASPEDCRRTLARKQERQWTSGSSFARICSVKLPADAAIALEKLTKYLLVRQARGDKSVFLAEAGYTAANPDQLLHDLRRQVLSKEAIPVGETKFGELYEIRALLTSPTGTALRIRSIWMKEHLSGVTKFITLVPDKKR